MTCWMLVQLVSERDQATRGAALAALEMAWGQVGQDLWPALGHLTDQQRSLIEERLKFADRGAAAAAAAAERSAGPSNLLPGPRCFPAGSALASQLPQCR